MPEPVTPLALLLLREPWRANVGRPIRVDDPLWEPSDAEDCLGELHKHEESPGHLHCTTCGYITEQPQLPGMSGLQPRKHKPVLAPAALRARAQATFKRTRTEQGEPPEFTQQQMDVLYAAVLGAAIRITPKQLEPLLKELQATGLRL